jgi:hypothetical protein
MSLYIPTEPSRLMKPSAPARASNEGFLRPVVPHRRKRIDRGGRAGIATAKLCRFCGIGTYEEHHPTACRLILAASHPMRSPLGQARDQTVEAAWFPDRTLRAPAHGTDVFAFAKSIGRESAKDSPRKPASVRRDPCVRPAFVCVWCVRSPRLCAFCVRRCVRPCVPRAAVCAARARHPRSCRN